MRDDERKPLKRKKKLNENPQLSDDNSDLMIGTNNRKEIDSNHSQAAKNQKKIQQLRHQSKEGAMLLFVLASRSLAPKMATLEY